MISTWVNLIHPVPDGITRWIQPVGYTNPGQRPKWSDGIGMRLPGGWFLLACRDQPCRRKFVGTQRHHFAPHGDGMCIYCHEPSEERLLIGAAFGERWAERRVTGRSR